MELRTEPFVLNIGPVHPSTHGVFRMRTTLDGEVVLDLEPVFGYLHRGIEKLAEERTYGGIIPLTDRLDYVSSMTNNLAYVLTVEKLAGIVVPERAEYLRIIMSELQRIAAHLVSVGSFFNDCGAYFTPFLYMYRERENICDLFDMVCGQRLLYNYMRIGGVSQDIPEEFMPALKRIIVRLKERVDEYDQYLKENEILLARTIGVGILPREMAVNIGASGPVLRGSGVKWDLRKADPYSIYDRFEFDIPTGVQGDCYDRYRVRVEEMRQSLRILEQVVEQVPDGEVRADVPHLIRPPVGEAYDHVEGPTGEVGFHLVSDGSIAPYRCHIRAPSLMNLTALRDMIVGWKIQDLIVIFGSFAITMGEIDR
ncbi:MAG TPA: NADH-quinone oxidoreductase subunit D [Dehalococcoidia bacterium]|nr:NADH-quinone oxidoreductase subunit D [Dehalococcoidia bacterium]